MDVQRGMEPAKDLMRKSQMDVQMDQENKIFQYLAEEYSRYKSYQIILFYKNLIFLVNKLRLSRVSNKSLSKGLYL